MNPEVNVGDLYNTPTKDIIEITAVDPSKDSVVYIYANGHERADWLEDFKMGIIEGSYKLIRR